jgi:ATP-dependent RNA helicase DDX27
MDVAAIIAAKRQALKNKSKSDVDDENKDDQKEEKEDDDENSDPESENENKNDSDDNDDTNNEEEESEDGSDSDSDDDDSDDDDDEVDDADREMEEDVLKTRMGEEEKKEVEPQEDDVVDDEEEEGSNDDGGDDDQEDEDEEEARKVAKFFESTTTSEDIEVFAELTLSRPLLRGVAAMGYVTPTPIQVSVIPVALAGRDICASAVTGSGKTGAFLLPILERLLYRPTGHIKALILTPTRELAAQIIGMMSTLSQFTKVSSALIVGGSKNVNSQMAELRARPQVVVGTPGRLLDHVMNSTGVSLDDIEFLVLDEADRLLDLGFQEEVTELIKACPIERQTMLFSATMNTKVDDLISLSLKRPVRIRITGKNSNNSKDLEVAPRLEQEFIRVRSGNEGINREGMLLALLTRTFSSQTIVFFDTKAKAHRMMILCGLCGIQCAELHGNLSQPQRLESLEKFRKGEVDILLATDLAARGLDISRVETVINFEMPNQVETYIHRIGRTARAGRGGRSCTLIGEGRRHLMKEIMKDAVDKNKSNQKKKKSAVIRSRAVPAAVIGHFVAKIQSLEPHIEEVREAEAVARMDRLADMEAAKAQNIITHSNEIGARPQRQWFASEREKKQTREAATEKAKMIAEKVGTGVHRMTRKKRRAREAKQELEEFQNEQAGEDGQNEDGKPQNRLPSIKQVAREKKRELEDRDRERNSMSIHELDLAREKKKKRKGATAQDAFGDSTLFGEEKIAYAPKKKAGEEEERVQSNYNFQGFDPAKDGKKKPKKKGVHKFKSKSKYKRK